MTYEENNHLFEFLENANFNKGSGWVFYCKKCLKIKMIEKKINFSDID